MSAMDMVETVLPRATKVRIAGNNRTRPSLVGQLGYIKSGQSLGGWHEVVLEVSDFGIKKIESIQYMLL